MYENEIIELEDFSFNHYIHHFEECDLEYLDYNDEYQCPEIEADSIDDIIGI